MNLTHISKNQRDYLGPVNPNVTQQPDSWNKMAEKEPNNGYELKMNSNIKIEDLMSTIDSLRSENQSMNVMIRTKNQQITNLKIQLKEAGANGRIQQNKNVRQIYFLNGLPIDAQSETKRSVELDRAIYLIKALTKERDDLKKHCQQYERGHGVINSIQHNPTIDLNKQKQKEKLIEQYEEHIASLSSKLSTVLKLQTDVAQLTQERAHILNDFENIRAQLIDRIGYTQHLESELRRLDHELNQRGPAVLTNNAQFQTLLSRNAVLESEIAKLNKVVAERDQKISQIQIGKSGYVQVTKQAFQSMQVNINNLQQKLNTVTESQRKQAEKASNFQIQINRLDRELGQKKRKAETESQRCQKLEIERNQLTSSLSKIKAEFKQMQKKYEDTKFDFERIQAQNEKNKKNGNLLQQALPQLQKYKKVAKTSEQVCKNLQSQVSKIEGEYRKMRKQNQECRELAEEYKVKWQSYDKSLKRQNEYIMKLNDACTKRLEEVDVNIEKNINLQTKLRELLRINDPLTDEIEQYIKENQYVRAADMTY